MKTTAFNHELIRIRREQAGWSREDLIVELAKLGVRTHSNTIANWESGETSPDADALPKLAQALRTSVSDFYNGNRS